MDMGGAGGDQNTQSTGAAMGTNALDDLLGGPSV